MKIQISSPFRLNSLSIDFIHAVLSACGVTDLVVTGSQTAEDGNSLLLDVSRQPTSQEISAVVAFIAANPIVITAPA